MISYCIIPAIRLLLPANKLQLPVNREQLPVSRLVRLEAAARMRMMRARKLPPGVEVLVKW
jgi:hypothetical protein